MNLKVLNDFLLIKPDEREFVDENPEVVRILKEGLIVLPEAYEGAFNKSPMRGEIAAFGDNCRYEHKIGEKIIFARFSGTNLEQNGSKFILIKEQDALAKEE